MLDQNAQQLNHTKYKMHNTQVSTSSIAQNASLLLRRGAAYLAKSTTSCKEKHMGRYNIHTQKLKN